MMTWREIISSMPRNNDSINHWFRAAARGIDREIPENGTRYLHQIVIRISPKVNNPPVFRNYNWITVDFDVPAISTVEEFGIHPVFNNSTVQFLNTKFEVIGESNLQTMDFNRNTN